MKQEIIGTIVSVEPQAADTYLVELESEALKDVTVFEIVSIGLPFEHIGLDRAGGSRLKLTCTGRSAVHPGEKVKILIDTLEREEACHGGPASARKPDQRSIEQASEPVGTFAGPSDQVIRTREGDPVPQDTGSQGGGQN